MSKPVVIAIDDDSELELIRAELKKLGRTGLQREDQS
jgi:hypothetical protein